MHLSQTLLWHEMGGGAIYKKFCNV
uniref:Uncharacterized protein n=1 Tax=Anguilla anguilla TaxID=7936 RepID=A0A0E9Q0W6_ANGAN